MPKVMRFERPANRSYARVGLPGDPPVPANTDDKAMRARIRAQRLRTSEARDRGDELLARFAQRREEDAALRAELADLRRLVRAAGLNALHRQARKRRATED